MNPLVTSQGPFFWIGSTQNDKATVEFPFDHQLAVGESLDYKLIGGDGAGKLGTLKVEVAGLRKIQFPAPAKSTGGGLGTLASGFIRFFKPAAPPVVIPDLDIPEHFPLTLEKRLQNFSLLINLDIPDSFTPAPAPSGSLPQPEPGNAAAKLIEATNLPTAGEPGPTVPGWLWIVLAAVAGWFILRK